MKLVFITLILSLSSCSSASTLGGTKDQDIRKLKILSGDMQDLCTSDKTFELGEHCTVSFALEDLEATNSPHVFKSHACEDVDPIIITLDLENNMPWHAARLNHTTNEWTELTPLPDDPSGCMYTSVSYLGDTHDLLHDDERDDRRRRGLEIDQGARKLQTCSEYKVIRMAIKYDNDFCQKYGHGTEEGAEAFINTIITMMNPFFNVAPLCVKVTTCSIEGSCSASNDFWGNLKRTSSSVCDPTDGNDLLDKIKAQYSTGPPSGCDTTHLWVGGETYPEDTIGCAEVGHLCEKEAVGLSFMAAESYPLAVYVWLAMHELGHSLGGEHVLGQDQYIMSYGYLPDRFKSTNIDRMVNYITSTHAKDPTCTATETVGFPTSAPCTGYEFRLVLQTDDYPDETHWDVAGANGIMVVQGTYYSPNTRYEINECLPSGTAYTFTIHDSYGDGICCGGGDGNYKIYIGGTLVHSSNGRFGSEEVVPLSQGNNSSPPTPNPTPAPVPSPTLAPVPSPTLAPVPSPTLAPVPNPTLAPVPSPTLAPVPNPTLAPVPSPTLAPVPTPTLAPVPSPTSPPVNSPTPGPTPNAPTPPSPTPPSSGCPSGQMEIEFTIRTDDWGEETSWEVVSSTGKTLVSGSNYESDKTYRKITCIPDGCYTLTIFDDYGDGLSEGGRNPGYELKIDGQVIAAEGGVDFGYEKNIDFGTCGGGGSGGGSCLPITLNLRTDDYGYETDLFLLTDTGNRIWNANSFANNKDYQFTTCLDSSECATLDIFDEWGDGIESPGFIKLTVDGTVRYNSGDFGEGIVFRIGLGC